MHRNISVPPIHKKHPNKKRGETDGTKDRLSPHNIRLFQLKYINFLLQTGHRISQSFNLYLHVAL